MWKIEEDDILKSKYHDGLRGSELLPYIKDRSLPGIQNRIRTLGLYKNHWTKDETDKLKDCYRDRLNIRSIQPFFNNRSILAIETKAERMGLGRYKKQLDWSSEEDDILRDNYLNMGTRELRCLLPQRTAGAINARVHENLKPNFRYRMSSSQRIYRLNERVFSTINNANSYYAGLIASDGCITDNATALVFGNQIRDLKMIESLKKFAGYEGPMQITKDGKYCRLSIHSVRMCEDIIDNFNIVPRKSLILEPPFKLNREQSLYFVRGYIDGDGCIGYYDKNNSLSLQIVGGSFTMMEWFKKILVGDCKYKYICKQKNSNSFHFGILLNKYIGITRELYNLDVPFNMNRKWDKVKALIRSNNG